jgi:hypothetical protein
LLSLVVSLYEGQNPTRHLIDVAEAMGVSIQTASNWLGGKSGPGLSHWRKLYDLTRNELILRYIRLHWPEMVAE